MSKKRASRNTKKVLKALKNKRLRKMVGGIQTGDVAGYLAGGGDFGAFDNSMPGINFSPTMTSIPMAMGNPSLAVEGVGLSATPRIEGVNTDLGGLDDVIALGRQSAADAASVADPEPKRSDYPGGPGGQNQYRNAHNAWKARQGENSRGSDGGSNTGPQTGDKKTEDGKTYYYYEGKGWVHVPDPAAEEQYQMTEDKKQRIQDTAERTEKIASGDPDALQPPMADVEETDSTIVTAAKDIEEIKDRDPTTKPADIVAQDITTQTGTAGEAKVDATTLAKAAKTDTYDAKMVGDLDPTKAAQGVVSKEAIARAEGPTLTERAVAAERDTAQEKAALAGEVDFDISDGAYVDKVTGKTTDVAPTPEAEKNQREAIIGQPATAGQAAEIIGIIGYEQIKNRSYSGREAAAGATNMLSELGNLPTNVSTSIVEDPATVEAQLDEQPVEVRAAVAALPTEALVSSQMESLLAGMEDGKTPAWARPAVAAIEQKLAARGLSASTVGRDALFNAIIQSALPMAQSNAQALQQRAAQNLSNEQQANLTQATQDMQRRMANLANRQTAEGQTAQYAQQMSVLQSQFTQQGVMAEMQVANDFLARNAGFQQQMNLANLSNDQQMKLANLSALNQASSENLTAEQQTDLANLNVRMQTNLTQAKIAQQMGIAQLNVDQQRAVQNAAMTARVDLTKFSADQQTELANSKFMQTMTMADFNAEQQAAMQNATMMAQMDLAAADQRTKLAITNAQSFLAMDMANLSNRQQANVLDQQLKQQRLLSDQSATNAAKQFNAASKNQTDQFMASLASNMSQFNTSQANAMEQFNASEANRASALEAQNKLEADKANADIAAKINTFDAELQFRTDQWNAANAQAVEQSNIEWRRKSNTIDTAAQNAANQQNASFAFNMSSTAQAQLWQELRDQATFDFQASQADIDRKVNVVNAALGNEALMTEDTLRSQRNTIFKMLDDIR